MITQIVQLNNKTYHATEPNNTTDATFTLAPLNATVSFNVETFVFLFQYKKTL